MASNIRFKDAKDGTHPTVYFVVIPCKTITKADGSIKKEPQKPHVGSALAVSHLFPHANSGLEVVYTLSNNKLKNDKALFATREEAEMECANILEMLRKADAGIKPKKGEDA